MAIFISVVSHGHGRLISNLGCLEKLAVDHTVVVKSNIGGDDLHALNEMSSVHWIDSSYGLGFGANNNIIYEYCKRELSLSSDDYFLVLNPDVIISEESLRDLVLKMDAENKRLSTINLFKNDSYSEYDNSIRHFPTLLQFASSFLGLGNKTIIDKSNINTRTDVDWGAGSFLCFKASHYEELKGFDERYFMYCEDIDICYRSHLMNVAVVYYPEIRAIHLAKHANRKVLSKHFIWHVSSVIRFTVGKIKK